jgi:hypothetical protein
MLKNGSVHGWSLMGCVVLGVLITLALTRFAALPDGYTIRAGAEYPPFHLTNAVDYCPTHGVNHKH